MVNNRNLLTTAQNKMLDIVTTQYYITHKSTYEMNAKELGKFIAYGVQRSNDIAVGSAEKLKNEYGYFSNVNVDAEGEMWVTLSDEFMEIMDNSRTGWFNVGLFRVDNRKVNVYAIGSLISNYFTGSSKDVAFVPCIDVMYCMRGQFIKRIEKIGWREAAGRVLENLDELKKVGIIKNYDVVHEGSVLKVDEDRNDAGNFIKAKIRMKPDPNFQHYIRTINFAEYKNTNKEWNIKGKGRIRKAVK